MKRINAQYMPYIMIHQYQQSFWCGFFSFLFLYFIFFIKCIFANYLTSYWNFDLAA